MDALDIAYIAFIVIVIITGIICIMIFVPKEREKRKNTENCYHYVLKGGMMTRSSEKASLYEKVSAHFYIERGPFEVDGVADGIKGKDGKSYKAIAIMSLYIPESLADTAANIFCKMDQDTIIETLSETMSEALAVKLAEYSEDRDFEEFKKDYREYTEKKLMALGYLAEAFSGLRISEDIR